MGNAFFLVIAGLLLFYVVISDRFYCVEGCIACLGGEYVSADKGNTVSASGTWGGVPSGAIGQVAPSVGGILGVGGR